jgi:hypothetical protein
MNRQQRKRLGSELRLIRRRLGSLRRCGVPGVEADLRAAGILVDQALYNLGVEPGSGAGVPRASAARRARPTR